jgi:alpha-mannosidase
MLHFETYGNWQARQVMVKAEFDFSFVADGVVSDMPYGVIERDSRIVVDTETGEEAAEDGTQVGAQRQEPDRPMQKWLDFSDGEKGVAILNNGKYGYDSTPTGVRLSLMRAPFVRDGEIAGPVGRSCIQPSACLHSGGPARGRL